MLRHLGKPVVLTGSQIPIEAQDTDAKKNLFDAICFACEAVRGVFVAFDGKIIHGAHATKCRTRSRDAFASINFPVIAHVENGLAVYTQQIQQTAFWHRMHEKTADSFCAQPELCRDVFVLKLFPGMRAEIFDYIRQNFRGVVIESFGIGGIPNEQPEKYRSWRRRVLQWLSPRSVCMRASIWIFTPSARAWQNKKSLLRETKRRSSSL